MDYAEFDNVLQTISWDDVLCLNEAEEAYNVWATNLLMCEIPICTHKKEKSSS